MRQGGVSRCESLPKFWYFYRHLSPEIQALADQCFELLKSHPHHPSLRLKKVGEFWSVRVSLRYRVLAREHEDGLIWFWEGSHSDYDQLISQ